MHWKIRSFIHLKLRSLRFWFQRHTLGYDYSSIWCVTSYLAKTMLPVIKLYKDQKGGRGVNWREENDNLDEIIWCFTRILNEKDTWWPYSEDADRVRAGLLLFAERVPGYGV
jgi:hypothetical protein